VLPRDVGSNKNTTCYLDSQFVPPDPLNNWSLDPCRSQCTSQLKGLIPWMWQGNTVEVRHLRKESPREPKTKGGRRGQGGNVKLKHTPVFPLTESESAPQLSSTLDKLHSDEATYAARIRQVNTARGNLSAQHTAEIIQLSCIAGPIRSTPMRLETWGMERGKQFAFGSTCAKVLATENTMICDPLVDQE
jgi:hypothetical protein